MTTLSSTSINLLIVDDDPSVRDILQEAPEQAGYSITLANNGESALAAFAACPFDLMILDVSMPVLDGWAVLREVRAHSDLPVLMLTGHGQELDQLTGFGLGGDDYMVKPFSVKQILARVQAILRRTGHPDRKLIYSGALILDLTAYEVHLGNQRVPLTAREFALLEVLIRNPNRVFTRADLLSRCWAVGYDGVDRVVDVHLASLRRKLGSESKMLVTVRGVGYSFKPSL